MRINIAATGRFHLCNLAVELDKIGHDVRFYSYVPPKRLRKFGLRRECSCSLYWIMLPLLACLKITHRAHWAVKLEWFFMDHLVGFFMRDCDVFIAMSTIYVRSFTIAKTKFGAKTFLERGSVHALEIKELYDSNGLDRNGKGANYFALTSDYAIARELISYNIVDFISIASTSVKDSFIKNGVDSGKLFVNPYGEDLGRFFPTELDNTDNYDIIMVGNWSWMKGCDLLIEACRILNLKLLHVGGLSMPFPCENNFIDVGIVDNTKVINYLQKAKVFVLASRQEGLAMVQIQALAAGLPLVCSKYTGGETIRDLIENKDAIKVFDPYDLESLCNSICAALDYAKLQHGIRVIDPRFQEIFSSSSYAIRYEEFINKIMNN